MSDALDYLAKVRPEAMGAYFEFLRACGGSLDPKTRALISLITKVATQTERGFRQYLRRALAAGATADEILDALLAAFPALGLTKIVWAVDLLLAMDLPEFSPEALTGAGTWHDVAALDDLPQSTSRLSGDGRSLFVHRDGQRLRVYDSRCPHQGTDIPAEALGNGRLVCPKHGWTFDPATGACVARGRRPLVELACRAEGGRLLVRW